MEERFNFRKLNVYQKSLELVDFAYDLIDKFPKEEKFGICDQLRRAVVSVPSNIAEGMNRFSDKEKMHFLEISNGSLMESLCQFEISRNRKYITQFDYQFMEDKIFEISKMLHSLHSSLAKQK